MASSLPIALRYLPPDYPLFWMIVGFFGWAFFRALRRLFRGIGEKKTLDAEIKALVESTEGPLGGLASEVDASQDQV